MNQISTQQQIKKNNDEIVKPIHFQTKQYAKWNKDDTQKMIQLTSQYKNTQINWNSVSTYFENRTVQQCKSFYNNKIRAFSFQSLLSQNQNIENLAKKAVVYIVSAKRNIELISPKHLCIAHIVAVIKEHIAKAFEGDSLFQFDLNIIKLIQSIIIIYKTNINTFIKRVSQFGCAKFEDSVLTADQVAQLVNFMDSFDHNALLEIVEVLILVKSQEEC
ncbi:Myb-like_DNA-binding domain-containing protein [Hexamita inflata]|uniref:Myb-like DNA-binding domain-containing protein n=1 Tax=Hexamita inflata TaxID=28002 RepID=A0AA86U5M0_9EUKA|nr:Myb-like DNA-binding domain-containing protein [Hexamita inflata]